MGLGVGEGEAERTVGSEVEKVVEREMGERRRESATGREGRERK